MHLRVVIYMAFRNQIVYLSSPCLQIRLYSCDFQITDLHGRCWVLSPYNDPT